jgi:hypothetical protein
MHEDDIELPPSAMAAVGSALLRREALKVVGGLFHRLELGESAALVAHKGRRARYEANARWIDQLKLVRRQCFELTLRQQRFVNALPW